MVQVWCTEIVIWTYLHIPVLWETFLETLKTKSDQWMKLLVDKADCVHHSWIKDVRACMTWNWLIEYCPWLFYLWEQVIVHVTNHISNTAGFAWIGTGLLTISLLPNCKCMSSTGSWASELLVDSTDLCIFGDLVLGHFLFRPRNICWYFRGISIKYNIVDTGHAH